MRKRTLTTAEAISVLLFFAGFFLLMEALIRGMGFLFLLFWVPDAFLFSRWPILLLVVGLPLTVRAWLRGCFEDEQQVREIRVWAKCSRCRDRGFQSIPRFVFPGDDPP